MSAYGCSWVNTPAFDLVTAEGLLINRVYTLRQGFNLGPNPKQSGSQKNGGTLKQ